MSLKDHVKNMVNRGDKTPPPLKSAELSSVESEVDEITRNLEKERQTREGLGKFLKHPFQVLTEKPVNIPPHGPARPDYFHRRFCFIGNVVWDRSPVYLDFG